MNRHSALSRAAAVPAGRAETEAVLRTIAFTIAGCRFALPITAVLQVSPRPPLLSDRAEAIGLAMHEERTILLLNLHVKLAPQPLPTVAPQGTAAPEPPSYLILTQTPRGELCGILIDELPTMLELPRAAVQPIPQSYRQAHLFDLARFVALWSPEPTAEKVAVYLLDIEQAIRYLS